MPHPELAAMIANALKTGLPHPGRPDLKEGPRTIPLVAFRTAGLPEPMREHVEATAQVCGEAIINLIETRGRKRTIVDNEELAQLRANDDSPTEQIAICCRKCKQPILWVSMSNGRALVNPALLSKANMACPHTMEDTA